MQRPVEIIAMANARGLHRADQHPACVPGPTGSPAARNARAKCMMFSGSGPFSSFLSGDFHQFVACHRLRPHLLRRMREASLPCIFTMSS